MTISPVNPVTRILSLCGMSERQFRLRFDYSKQFLVDITAGTFTGLPDSIHRALRELVTEKGVDAGAVLVSEYDTVSLDEAYRLWQTEQRYAMRYRFDEIKPNVWSRKESPAKLFVLNSSGSPTRFSKDLCVPPQTVRRWISGETKTMPEAIEAALRQIRYPWLRDLIENQAAWVEEHR